MGDIILLVTGFSSDRRKVRVFYHFVMLIFCLVLRIIFVKKTLITTFSVFYSQSGVNNAHKFVINGLSTFLERKVVNYKTVTNCQKKIFRLCSSFSKAKPGPEVVKRWN